MSIGSVHIKQPSQCKREPTAVIGNSPPTFLGCISEIREHVLKHTKEALVICTAFFTGAIMAARYMDGRIRCHDPPNINDEEAGPPIKQAYGVEKERHMRGGLLIGARDEESLC
jgi:hypothetical protein